MPVQVPTLRLSHSTSALPFVSFEWIRDSFIYSIYLYIIICKGEWCIWRWPAPLNPFVVGAILILPLVWYSVSFSVDYRYGEWKTNWHLKEHVQRGKFGVWSRSGLVIKITRIMVHQKNRRILVQSGFIGSFDAPWSEWSWITDPNRNHPKGKYPWFLRLVSWHGNQFPYNVKSLLHSLITSRNSIAEIKCKTVVCSRPCILSRKRGTLIISKGFCLKYTKLCSDKQFWGQQWSRIIEHSVLKDWKVPILVYHIGYCN